jgi:hypothetical protein
MMLDAILCAFLGVRPRWTAVVVDRFDGQEHPIESVRFRWRRNADRWVTRYAPNRAPAGLELPPRIEVRPLCGE